MIVLSVTIELALSDFFTSLDKIRMIRCAMIYNEVDDNSYSTLVALFNKLVKSLKRTKLRVNIKIIPPD